MQTMHHIALRDGAVPRFPEYAEAPRENQGIATSLARAFRADALPSDMQRMLARIR